MKITKKQRIETLERKVAGLTTMLTMLQVWSDHADNMLTELNHALPDPEYDAKCEAQEANIDASLDRHRERLGLNKPQLKQLGQSIFDGVDSRYSYFAIDEDGMGGFYEQKPELCGDYFTSGHGWHQVGQYDASNWQNSLIERDDIAKKLAEVDLSSELTGSELCKAMIIGDRDWVLAYVSNENDATALFHRNAIVVTDFDLSEDAFYCRGENWDYAVPINNQGEPLTASEVGL